MVTLETRQKIDESHQELEEKLTHQVSEIIEASEAVEAQAPDRPPAAPRWNFSMPFAGVRYYTYD